MEYDLGYSIWRKKLCSPAQPVRAKSVTYVLGTIRYPCLGTGQLESWWRRRESNPRPKKPAVKRLRAFPIQCLSAAALEPARKRRLSPIIVSLLLRAEALGPILEDDAHRIPSRPGTLGGYLEIKQRKRTVDWQFWFSDRFTGARNPARLPTTIQSRRIRCAPLFHSMIAFRTRIHPAAIIGMSHGHHCLAWDQAGNP